MSFQQVLNEQRSLICAQLGHSWHFILPAQKRDDVKAVLSACTTCQLESWITLPADGYEQFLNDLASEKIK